MYQCRCTDHRRHRHWSSLIALKHWHWIHWWHWYPDTEPTEGTDILSLIYTVYTEILTLTLLVTPMHWNWKKTESVARWVTDSIEELTIIYVRMHRFKPIFQWVGALGGLSVSISVKPVKSVSVSQCIQCISVTVCRCLRWAQCQDISVISESSVSTSALSVNSVSVPSVSVFQWAHRHRYMPNSDENIRNQESAQDLASLSDSWEKSVSGRLKGLCVPHCARSAVIRCVVIWPE